MSEAPTFTGLATEWSTMVVPTYPEGGSHAQPAGVPAPPPGCASRPLCRVVRDSRNTLLATAPADSVETFTVAQRTQCALCDREGGGGGGRSVHACAVFLGAAWGGTSSGRHAQTYKLSCCSLRHESPV